MHNALCTDLAAYSKYQLPGAEMYGVNAMGILMPDSPFAVLRNPAFADAGTETVLALDYSSLFTGLPAETGNLPGYYPVDVSMFGAGIKVPVRKFGFNVSYSGISAASLFSRTMVSVSASAPFDEGKRKFGASLKFISKKYSRVIDLSEFFLKNSDSASAFTMDLGFVENLNDSLVMGLSLKNIIPASTGIVYNDPVPFEYAGTVGFRAEDMNLAAEINGESITGAPGFSAGIQYHLLPDMFDVRMGGNEKSLHFGFSVQVKSFRFSYTAGFPYTMTEMALNHRMEISFIK